MSYRHSLLGLSLTAALAISGTALAEAPYEKVDRSWVNLTGDVVTVVGDEFTIDYGEGLITVEMDDWDWFNEASQLVPGDTVSVTGRIDADLYERRTVEAERVYVYDRNTYYFASDADEELANYMLPPVTTVPDNTWLSVTGTVKEIDGREFVLDMGRDSIRVDTITMSYNPLDKTGFQQVSKGDRVAVSGEMDLDFFEKREIQADSITTLTRDRTRKSS